MTHACPVVKWSFLQVRAPSPTDRATDFLRNPHIFTEQFPSPPPSLCIQAVLIIQGQFQQNSTIRRGQPEVRRI